MSAVIKSLSDQGMSGVVIEVECHFSNSLPSVVIVGVANKAVDEAKERLRGAYTSSKLELPRKRITLNLAPADIPKEGSSYDLPMALAILLTSGQIKPSSVLDQTIVFGELGLDGSVRPVRGIIGKILAAKKQGFDKFIIPQKNLVQVDLIPDVEYIATDSLLEITKVLSYNPSFTRSSGRLRKGDLPVYDSDFSDVIGQPAAKRALEIAAAGQHNVMLSGAPGTGKSMLAKALPSILPELTRQEMLEVTHIHSLASNQYDKIVSRRPFRSPHHSSSSVAIIGGGSKPKPGEISLAHNGVLFIDEIPEFQRMTIETLRQPLEDRIINIARAKDSLEFPADFILVATRNPCPCGYYGSENTCVCSPQQIVMYNKKLSGPIMDRIDLYVDVDAVDHTALLSRHTGEEKSEQIAKRVSRARQVQLDRMENNSKLNGSLSARSVKQVAGLSETAKLLMDNASAKMKLSARAYMRAIRVARTIADLDGAITVNDGHIAEALQYRPKQVEI